MDTTTWVILCAGIGSIGTFVGYLFGAGVTAQHWQKVVATREEAFRQAFQGKTGPLYWYWWTGRDDTGLDYGVLDREWLVGVMAEDEKEAKMKLNPAKIPLLAKARAAGRKDVGTHVLIAHSKEEINVQGV